MLSKALGLAEFLTPFLDVGFSKRQGNPALSTARYPPVMEGSTLTLVILVAIAFCVGIYLYLWGTRTGYELRLVGENPEAARYAGVRAGNVLLLSFLIGGLAAGLAGASQITGRAPAWALYATLGNVITLGFDGIGVALVARNHPIGGIFAAILFGTLQHGGRYMEYHVRVPSELVRAINGLIVITLAVPEVWTIIRRRLKR